MPSGPCMMIHVSIPPSDIIAVALMFLGACIVTGLVALWSAHRRSLEEE